MERKTPLTPKRRHRLIITENFLKELKIILLYSASQFGDSVAQEFEKDLLSRIKTLPSFPHANPKSRFLISTTNKVYRNIIFRKYFVIYSVTKS